MSRPSKSPAPRRASPAALRRLALGWAPCLGWALCLGWVLCLASPAHAARGAGDGVYGAARADYTHVFVPASGAFDLQGADPGADLRDVEGHMALQLVGGTRGLGHATLRSHLLGQLLWDPYGPPGGDAVSGWPSILHGPGVGGDLLVLHLAYAELDGFTEQGALADVHLRAGRQFHWGVVPLTFDGLTAGYDDGRFGVAVRAGRRSAVYDPDPDLDDSEVIAGVDGWWRSGRRLGLRLGAEYLVHRRTLTLISRDGLLEPTLEVEQTTHLGELTIAYLPDRAWSMQMSGTFVDGGVDGIEAEVAYGGDDFDVVLRGRQQVGDGLAYDLALGLAPRFAGRATTYETHRLTVPDVGAHTDVELSGEWFPTAGTALVAGIGGRRSLVDRHLTVYDADHIRWTGGFRTGVEIDRTSGLEIDLTYTGTDYQRSRDPADAFADPTVGGERTAHLVDGGLRYVRGRRRIGGRLLTARTLSLGARAYAQRWTLDNRFIRPLDETAIGAGVDVMARVSDHLALRASYETVRDATTATRWLAPLHGLRVGLEGTL